MNVLTLVLLRCNEGLTWWHMVSQTSCVFTAIWARSTTNLSYLPPFHSFFTCTQTNLDAYSFYPMQTHTHKKHSFLICTKTNLGSPGSFHTHTHNNNSLLAYTSTFLRTVSLTIQDLTNLIHPQKKKFTTTTQSIKKTNKTKNKHH